MVNLVALPSPRARPRDPGDGATQAVLATMPPGTRDEVRDYAKARLVALGWPKRAGRRSAA